MQLLQQIPVTEEGWHDRSSLNGKANGRHISTFATQDPPQELGEWDATLDEMAGFQNLGDNWDGQGAKVPTQELLASAIGLGRLISARGIPPPQRVVPGIEGSIIMEWQEP